VSLAEIHTVAQAAQIGLAFSFWLVLAPRRRSPREQGETLEIRIVQGEGCLLDASGQRFELPGATASATVEITLSGASTPQGGSVRVQLHRGGVR
jgi:hypothetical protein